MMSKADNKIERTFPVAMDDRGRITIPSNIRLAHDLDPAEGEEIWLEITLHEADIKESENNRGES